MSEQTNEVPSGMKQIRTEDNYETRWILIGPNGAVDFHCTNLAAMKRMRETTKMSDLPRSGGVEYHHRAAPDYMRNEAASHGRCWILGGPCWHDGTSLWASEHWIPLLERFGEAAIWQELHATYRRHEWPEVQPADAAEAP